MRNVGRLFYSENLIVWFDVWLIACTILSVIVYFIFFLSWICMTRAFSSRTRVVPPILLVSLFISRDYLQVLPPFAANSESIMVVLAKFWGVQLPFGQNCQNMYAPRATTQHGGIGNVLIPSLVFLPFLILCSRLLCESMIVCREHGS